MTTEEKKIEEEKNISDKTDNSGDNTEKNADVTVDESVASEEKEKADDKDKAVVVSGKKKSKKTVFKGQAHIKCTYNNTMITITDMNGATLGWSSAGLLGFKGAKKSTPFAATKVAADVSEKVKKFGLKELQVFIKGVGGGRESTVRGLAGAGFDILMIKDITPMPHNGCRRRRPRRV